MTCHNQYEVGEKLRDAPVTEVPHSVGVWRLKIEIYVFSFLFCPKFVSSEFKGFLTKMEGG